MSPLAALNKLFELKKHRVSLPKWVEYSICDAALIEDELKFNLLVKDAAVNFAVKEFKKVRQEADDYRLLLEKQIV